MERTVAEGAAQRCGSTPASRRRDRDRPGQIVLVIVDVELEGAREMLPGEFQQRYKSQLCRIERAVPTYILDKLAHAGFATNDPLRRTDDVISVRK